MKDKENISYSFGRGVGYIVGLTTNGYKGYDGEIIPIVKWVERDDPISIHYNNIQPYKD